METKEYLIIEKKSLPYIFEIRGNKVYLRNSPAKPININFPLVVDEEIAKVAGMLMDGSLDKNLKNCMFSQKKDVNKMKECYEIIKNKFNVKSVYYIAKKIGSHSVRVQKVMACFFYHCLNMHKCDESARIPSWIWKSPINVIREYLRYAYAMEGSVTQSHKSPEIRFHSVDLPYLKELKVLLKEKFGIDSDILKYYIKNYGWKYYLYVITYKNIKLFYEKVGIALVPHTERLKKHVDNINPKAWEITLVRIMDLGFWPFRIKDLHLLFPQLCLRSIHQRIQDLCALGYLKKTSEGYYVTHLGLNKASDIYSSTKRTSLRTNPQENEKQILIFINNKGKTFKSKISRATSINDVTVRDVLRRLVKKEKIQLIEKDRFGRKFYAPVYP